VECSWELVNLGAEEAHVAFYLHAEQATLSAFVCAQARTQCGRFNASANVVIPSGGRAKVSASLRPRGAGVHQVRVAVVTKDTAIERTREVTVPRSWAPTAARAPATLLPRLSSRWAGMLPA
jgi:hypothetical protein